MKREIFTSAGFTFLLVLAFILVLKPFNTDTLSMSGLFAYGLAAATISTIAVCLAIFVTWRWLMLSEEKYGYWGRVAIGVMVIPQILVGIALLNMVAFDSTWYQLIDRMIPITRNVLLITVAVFAFDYVLYRTIRNKSKNSNIRAIENRIKEQQEGLEITGRVSLSPTIETDAKNVIYCVFDGYYTKVYYITDKGTIKTRDIPVNVEGIIKELQPYIPTLIQCTKKHGVNTIYMESLNRNWFGKITMKLKVVKCSIPCMREYLSEYEK